jgi:hypothetical protein
MGNFFVSIFLSILLVPAVHTSVKQSNVPSSREPAAIIIPQSKVWDVGRDIHIVIVIKVTGAALPAPVSAPVTWKKGGGKVLRVPLPAVVASPVWAPNTRAVKSVFGEK